MSTKYLFAVTCLCVLVSAPTVAQDDPFSSGSNPFGEGGKVAPAKSSAAQAPAKLEPRARAAERPSSADVEERLQASLSDETSQSFRNTPLDEALQTISQLHDIPIVLDKRALEEVGVTPNTPVNLDLKNVTLRAFLRLMLHDLDLTYMIKDEVLQITTVEVAVNNLILKMHVVPKSLIGKSDEIVRALQATVQSDTWDAAGGPSTVVPIDNIIAISATADVQDQVGDFLLKLDAAYEKSKAENK